MITCGGFTRESALKIAEETGQLVGFAGAFSANVSSCHLLFVRVLPING